MQKLNYKKRKLIVPNTSKLEVLGEKQTITERLFGCWHLKMSNPRTIGKTTFSYCKKCGMRRKFDLQNSKYEGSFHNAPINNQPLFN
jgi:hypothetical protein